MRRAAAVVSTVLLLAISLLPLSQASAATATDATPVGKTSIWTFEFAPSGPAEASADQLALIGTIFTKRLDALGIASSCVSGAADGTVSVVIDASQVTDPDRVKKVLGDQGLLEIIDSQGEFLEQGTVVATSLDAAADGSPQPRYETIIFNSDLASVEKSTNTLGQPVLLFSLSALASIKLFAYTSAHIGEPMAIVIDKRVVATPVIQAAIGDQGIVDGLTEQDVDDLVAELSAGPLPVPVVLTASEQTDGEMPSDCASGEATTSQALEISSEVVNSEISDAVSAADAATLLNNLLTTPFAADEIPTGAGSANLQPWPEGDQDLEGALGGVSVTFTASDAGIGFIVFPEPADAVSHFETAAAAAESDEATSFAFQTGITGALWDYGGYTVCVVVVGDVWVLGYTAYASPDDAETGRQGAISLCEHGATHLRAVAQS